MAKKKKRIVAAGDIWKFIGTLSSSDEHWLVINEVEDDDGYWYGLCLNGELQGRTHSITVADENIRSWVKVA